MRKVKTKKLSYKQVAFTILVLLLTLATSIVSCAHATVAGGISPAKMRVEAKVPPSGNTMVDKVFMVANKGNESALVRLEAVGDIENWTCFEQNNFEVGPDERRFVNVSFDVPEGNYTGKIVVYFSPMETGDILGTGSSVGLSMGIKVTVVGTLEETNPLLLDWFQMLIFFIGICAIIPCTIMGFAVVWKRKKTSTIPHSSQSRKNRKSR